MTKTILDKLGLKLGMATRTHAIPASLAKAFPQTSKNEDTKAAWLLGFAEDSKAIKLAVDRLAQHYQRGGYFWICYPKKTGKIKTDITRDIGWEPLFNLDFLPVTQISIDETWSALRFRFKDEIKTLTRKTPTGG